jgi:hypothetical protein
MFARLKYCISVFVNNEAEEIQFQVLIVEM